MTDDASVVEAIEAESRKLQWQCGWTKDGPIMGPVSEGFRQGWVAGRIAEIDARAALTALREKDGWRPIGEAPRDGTDVLLWRGRFPPVVAGWYDNGETSGWASYDDPDEWLLDTFTHFRPLPAAPVVGEGR